ncbi:DUF547 domain-containing protein [Comamonadaceae bacterium G21597-S1]|nr:DUF547 domain-containing protein [Comamonadaceae bacterium G21597-S1]
MTERRLILAAATIALVLPSLAVRAQTGDASFDHRYAAWDALLKQHVRWLPDEKQSRVDYRGFASDRTALQQVLAQWSALTPARFAGFSREQKMAFLINAYNGFTVELILTRYPDLNSIKELGSLFQSPWKKKFFRLLGEERHLDWIEHEQLRPVYQDWRVHAAVNCASIGCPALRPEAFTAPQLDAQLDDGMKRFMSDRTRNRFNDGRAEISEIFKWFQEDFQKGHRGVGSIDKLLALYAEQLATKPADIAVLRSGTVRVRYLDYDWSLNDVSR